MNTKSFKERRKELYDFNRTHPVPKNFIWSASNMLVRAMHYQIPTASKSRSRRFREWWKKRKGRGRYCNDNRDYYRSIYLKSPHWKQLKSSKLNQVKTCEICGSNKSLDVHHLAYRNLYDVTLDDLQVLCRRCHATKHAIVVQ